jgi:hypothetical protein
MPGKYLRGAFIQFMPTFLVPLPNVIIFQFNPETMTHTWQPASPDSTPYADNKPNPLAVKGLPSESFSFNLAVDASDTIADGGGSNVVAAGTVPAAAAQAVAAGAAAAAAAQAVATGVHARLAALEMLLYPSGSFPSVKLLNSVSSIAKNVLAGSSSQKDTNVPQFVMPTVLFIWGPYRIIPVRVKNLTITEKLYDALLLNPTHAEAQITLDVLTPDEVSALQDKLKEVATVAYNYSQAFRQAMALANLTNGADSILGMLPFG